MNFKKMAIALSMCAGLALPSIASATPISQQEWVFSPGVVQADAEWLSLTRAHERATMSNLQSKRIFTPGETIHVEFDYLSWGGNEQSGDGLSLYLFDASLAGAGTGGGVGGALGYCQLGGAYLGIGLDEYGTFASTWCENRRQNNMPGTDTIVIRGSQARAYALGGTFPAKTGLACKGQSCTTRQQAIDLGGTRGVKRVVADLIPKKSGPGYSVNLSINGQMVVSGADYPYAAPATMRLGIAGSNGGPGGAHHEIRNLQVEAFGDVCAEPENPAHGVPAYLGEAGHNNVVAYPVLNDGDRVQKGWDGTGKWSGSWIGANVSYGLDFSGAACQDRDGPCATPAAKGPVLINTVTVYSRQDDSVQQEPSDSSVFTQYGAADFVVLGIEQGKTHWEEIARVSGNNLVKRTLSFPAKWISNLEVLVERSAGSGRSPSIVELEVFNR